MRHCPDMDLSYLSGSFVIGLFLLAYHLHGLLFRRDTLRHQRLNRLRRPASRSIFGDMTVEPPEGPDSIDPRNHDAVIPSRSDAFERVQKVKRA